MSSQKSTDSEYEGAEYSKITNDIVRTITYTTWKYYAALGIAFLVVLYGAGVYYYQSVNGLGVWGTNEPVFWGLDIPNFIFWIGVSHAGTLISALLLLTRTNWRKPIFRSAEAMTLFALVSAGTVLLTHLGRPWRFFYILPIPNLRYLWPNFRSPLLWDFAAITTYMTLSALFLYVGSIPDIAVLRDRVKKGWRKKLYNVLSLGWKGSDNEWRNLHRVSIIMASLLIPLVVSVHSIVAWDWAVTLVPGFHSLVFAPFFVVGAIFSGFAGVVILLSIVRKFFRLEDYIKITYFDHMGKVMLVLSLTLSYVYITEAIIPWYHEENFELMTLVSKIRGIFAPYFWLMVIGNSIVPLTLFSRKVRTTLPAMIIVAIWAQIGMYMERFVIIVPGLATTHLPTTWGVYIPSWVEISLTIWTFGIFSFLFLIFIKIIPAVSIFEVKELAKTPKRSSSGHQTTGVPPITIIDEFGENQERDSITPIESTEVKR